MKFPHRKRSKISAGSFFFVFVLILSAPAFSQTWLSSPADNDFNNTANWSPAAVPNSASATAIFDSSSTTNVGLSGDVTLGALQFNGGSPVYTLSTNINNIYLEGAGVINGSGTSQVLNDSGGLYLQNGASAGTLSIDNTGTVQLNDTASAGGASITNNGFLSAYNNSTLWNANILNNGSSSMNDFSTAANAHLNVAGGSWSFNGNSDAGSASIYNNGFTSFNQNTSAASATLLNDNFLGFFGSSTAANSSVTNNNNLSFFGSSTAANSNITNNSTLSFSNGSSAGNAAITNLNSVVFHDTSSAGSATIINNGPSLIFQDNASAGSASIFNVTGSAINFVNNSTAGSAILNNDDSILFTNGASAGSATILNNNNANLAFGGDNSSTFSTAGNAQITNDYSVDFFSYSTAGNSHITNNNSVLFEDNSSAGSATLLNSATGNLAFVSNSTAGDAMITNNNSLSFDNNATAGSAVIDNNNNLTFNGSSLAGSSSVSNAAGATIILNANSNGGSASILNNGYVQFDNSASAGSATIANNSSLYFFNNSDAGSASVSNSAGASIAFNNNTSANNSTIDNNGFLAFFDNSTAASSAITNGGSILFTGSSTAGSATLVNNAGATVQWVANADGGTARIINSGVFVLGNPPSQNVTVGSIEGNGTLLLGTQLVEGADNLSTTVSGLISGGGGLTKTGLGTLTLTGSNDHTGPTTIDSGILNITTDNALGNGGIVMHNATLQAGANIDTSGRDVLLAGDAIFDSNGFDSVASGVFSGTGSLTKVGSGSLTLTATNSYGGPTSIDGGVLNIGSMSNLGSNGTGGLVLDGGTLQVRNSIQTNQDITLDVFGGSFDTNALTLSLGGTLSGTGSLSKVGSGALTLTGTNTYDGGTNLNAGTIVVSNDNNLGTSGLSFNGGTLQTTAGISSAKSIFLFTTGTFDTNGFNSTLSGVIDGAGKMTKTGSGALTLTGSNATTGLFDIAQGSLVTGSTNSIAAASVSVEGPALFDLGGFDQQVASLTGSGVVSLGGNNLTVNNSTGNLFGGFIGGTGTLAKTGSGALTLTGNNSYSGGTSLNGGILAFSSDANLGTGDLSFNGGTLQLTAATNSNKNITLVGTGTVDTNGFGSNLFGSISGSGSLTKVGSGSLTILGANTYSGGTSLDGGVVDINSSNNLGTGNISFNGGALQAIGSVSLSNDVSLVSTGVLDTNGANTSLSGTISGSGTLTKTGIGSLILGHNNTTTGLFDVNNGSLVMGTVNAISSASVSVEASGVFDLGGYDQQIAGLSGSGVVAMGNNSLAVSNTAGSLFSGVITGTTALTKDGSGALTLTGNNTYSGGTTFKGGTVVVGNDNDLGAGDLSFNGGNLQVTSAFTSAKNISLITTGSFDTNGFNSTLSGFISGSGTLTKSGSGALTLTNNNGTSGLFDVAAGSLVLGTTNTISNASVSVEASGLLDLGGNDQQISGLAGSGLVSLGGNDLAINGSNNTSFGGVIAGTGALNIYGSGILALTGANTYSGGTTLNGGVLAINNDNNLGSGILTLNGGTLQTNASVISSRNINLTGASTVDSNGFNSAFSGVVSGGGTFTKIGGGVLALTGANTYTGGTVLNGGVLEVGNANALGGGSVAINAGTLADNGAALTMIVGGNYGQTAGSALRLGLGGTLAGQSDLLFVGGNADLSGDLILTFYNGYVPQIGDNLVVLNASSISGRFNQLSNPQGARWYPFYQSTQLSLLAIQPTFSVSGLTSNQSAVAAWLDKNYLDPALASVVPTVGVHAATALGGDFDLLAPTALTPLFKMGFATASAQSFLIERKLADLPGGSSAASFAAQMGNEELYAQVPAASPVRTDASTKKQTGDEKDWDVFLEGTGNLATITGDANAAGYQYSVAGVSGGADYSVAPGIKVGVLLGFAQGSATGTGSKVDVSGGSAGLFAGWRKNNLHAEALVSGSINQYATQRAGFGGVASGSAQGQQYSGWLNLGYDWRFGDNALGPFLSGQYTHVGINSFKETGSAAPLLIPGQGETSFSGQAGIHFQPSFKSKDMTLSPFLTAAWEQYFQGYQDSLSAGMGTLDSFSVTGPATGQSAVVFEGGANAALSSGLSLYAQYQGKLGMSNFISHDFSGGVNFGF